VHTRSIASSIYTHSLIKIESQLGCDLFRCVLPTSHMYNTSILSRVDFFVDVCCVLKNKRDNYFSTSCNVFYI
jgi:hypothetical protein